MIREYWSQRNQRQRTTDRSKTNYAKSARKRTTSAELSTKSVRVINVGELLLAQSLWHVDLLPAAGGTSALGSPPLRREPATCVTCGDVVQKYSSTPNNPDFRGAKPGPGFRTGYSFWTLGQTLVWSPVEIGVICSFSWILLHGTSIFQVLSLTSETTSVAQKQPKSRYG